MNISKFIFVAIILITTSSAFGQVVRWYTNDQVKQGQQLFKSKCAKCHGVNAEGEPDWRKTNEDGEYPPPPLNGQAYARHHSLDKLRQQIQVGSDLVDGEMPSFKNKLSATEIDAVIAFFQSKWTDTIYKTWQTGQLLSATKHLEESEEPKQHMGTHWLKQHLGGDKITPGEPMKTPVKGIREVKVNNDYLYLSEDGRYAFTGHMIDLINGSDLTVLNQALETKRLLQSYSIKDKLIYPAQGKEKTQLTIFTDTSCPYCRKMHKEVPLLQSEGVTVNVIPYPRRGLDGKGYTQLKLIWCSKDPKQALSTYIEERVLPDRKDKCEKTEAVDTGYSLGNSLGISGTPLLVLENGERIRGFKTTSNIIGRMNLPLEDR